MRTKIANLGYRYDISLRARSTSVPTTPWVSLVLVLAFAVLAYLVLPAQASFTVLSPMGAALGVAVVGGIRRSADPLAWNLLSAGVAVYVIGDLLGLTSGAFPTSGIASVSYVLAYAAFAGGFSAFIFRGR